MREELRFLLVRPSAGKGWREFRGESDKLAARLRDQGHQVEIHTFGVTAPKATRCALIEQRICELKPHRVVFFCHGGKTWLQPGWRVCVGVSDPKHSLPCSLGLASALVHGRVDRVVLYACSTAGGHGHMGDGGFADTLRDNVYFLARGKVGYEDCDGVQVVGHVGPGHCTRRPYVRWFDRPAAAGGAWVCVPPLRKGMDGTGRKHGHQPEVWRAWRNTLAWDGRWLVAEEESVEELARVYGPPRYTTIPAWPNGGRENP